MMQAPGDDGTNHAASFTVAIVTDSAASRPGVSGHDQGRGIIEVRAILADWFAGAYAEDFAT
jgi:hypothetical protein